MIRTRSGDAYKPAAIRAYEIAFRLRVKPEAGSLRLSQVTRTDMQDLVDSLVAEAAEPHGRRDGLRDQGDLQAGARRGEVAVNPVVGVRCRRTAPAAPDRGPAECARLLAALPQRDQPLWATAMYAGLRRGELMALRIEDVDLARGVIYVRRGWESGGGEITPKSGT